MKLVVSRRSIYTSPFSKTQAISEEYFRFLNFYPLLSTAETPEIAELRSGQTYIVFQ